MEKLSGAVTDISQVDTLRQDYIESRDIYIQSYSK